MSHSSENEDDSSFPLSPSRLSEQGSTMSLRSWTIPKITAELRRRGISFSATARKAELFKLLCSQSSPSSGDNVNNSVMQLHVMLNNLLDSLNDVQRRLEVLEARTTPSAIAVSPGKASIVQSSQVCIGTPVITAAHYVPESIKQDILEGKDINLASLLIDSREVLENECFSFGEVSIIMNAKDPRLNRMLNIPEFVLAFSIFRDVLCSANPDRREELDQYMYTVVDLGYKYGGFMFYNYHRSFSAKAAAYFSQFQQAINWALFDAELFCMHFSGLKAPVCNTCQSSLHTTNWCPNANQDAIPHTANPPSSTYTSSTQSSPGVDNLGRPIHYLGKVQICNNYNVLSCRYSQCQLLHICTSCFKAHPKVHCSKKRLDLAYD